MVPCPKTDLEKEKLAEDRMKAFIKENWSRMDQTLKNCYMEKLSGLGLWLNGELIEERVST
jgi:hypothetical protein